MAEQDAMADVTRLLNEAAVHIRAGRPGEAEASARDVLDVDPEHPGALHMLGVLAARAGRAEAAVDLLQRAIAAGAAGPGVHANLGNLLQSLGRLDAAAAAYRPIPEHR